VLQITFPLVKTTTSFTVVYQVSFTIILWKHRLIQSNYTENFEIWVHLPQEICFLRNVFIWLSYSFGIVHQLFIVNFWNVSRNQVLFSSSCRICKVKRFIRFVNDAYTTVFKMVNPVRRATSAVKLLWVGIF